MQPVVLGTSLRSAIAPAFTRSRSGLFALLLAAASLSSASLLGCDDGSSASPRGPIPSVVAVSAVSVDPQRDDAGIPLGGCCTISVTVTYVLPEGEFIREAHVQWTGLESPTVFQYPASDPVTGTVVPGTKIVSFDAQIPSVLVANGAKLPFTVVLVTGRGEKSAAAGSIATLTPKPAAR